MRTFAFILPLSLALASRDGDLSALFMPMEPTPASIAAPRRPLTEAEKEAISTAVTHRLGGAYPYAFRWFPLVVRSHDHRTDFCGLVSGELHRRRIRHPRRQREFPRLFRATDLQRGDRLAKVDVVSIGKTKHDNIPTATDSICMQDGYNVRG